MLKLKQLGNFGEEIAEKYLREKGYKILARNFKTKWGEIDLVGKRKKVITFFEVKTIRLLSASQKKGFSPEDRVDWKKKRQLVKMAQIYLSKNKIPLETPHQIDILTIEIDSQGKPEINHLENAIEDIY